MSARKKTGLAVLGLVVLAMLALGGYEFREFRTPKECGFCRRPLQEKLRVVVEIGGQAEGSLLPTVRRKRIAPGAQARSPDRRS